jgi:NAD-dependent DNA ligase
MPSEKVTKILLKRGLSEEKIRAMSEIGAWDQVYATEPPKKRDKGGPEICFTGFTDAEKEELSVLAIQANFHVVTSVTVGLSVLCVGAAPGEVKIKKATERNAKILTREELESAIRSGDFVSAI